MSSLEQAVQVEVRSFDERDQPIDTATCDVDGAFVTARQLVADHLSSRPTTQGARVTVRFLVRGRVVRTLTDRELRT